MTLEQQLTPERTALLVIDMQNDFCAVGGYLQKERNYDVSFAPAVAERIGAMVEHARQSGVSLVWIRSIYDFKYLNAAERAKRGTEGCCLEGTWGVDFFRLAPLDHEFIVDKHCFDAFKNPALDRYLRAKGIETLIITGVATNVCVDSTLRDGFFHGYNIVLLEDCVASNSSAGHEGTIATVRNNIGRVVTSGEAIDLLQRAPVA